jgi:large subunit ribosomal protein L29
VKKLRELRREIAQIKTVAKERELGIRGAAKDAAVDAKADAESKKGAR